MGSPGAGRRTARRSSRSCPSASRATVEWQGKPLRTASSSSPSPVPSRSSPLGLEGDVQSDLSVHGGIDKAVYAYDESNTAYWRERLRPPRSRARAPSARTSPSGLPDEEVFIGDRLQIGTACFEVSQPRQPCSKLAKRFEDATFPKRFLASLPRRLLPARRRAGRVAAGDPIVRIARDETSLSITESARLDLARPRRERGGPCPRSEPRSPGGCLADSAARATRRAAGLNRIGPSFLPSLGEGARLTLPP